MRNVKRQYTSPGENQISSEMEELLKGEPPGQKRN